MPQLGLSNQLTQENNQPAYIYVDSFCVDFDGSNDYLAIGGTTFDDIWVNGGTISILFRGAPTNGDILLSKKDDGADGWALSIEDTYTGPISDIRFLVDWAGDDLQYQTTARDIKWNDSQWNHVVITYNSSAFRNTPNFYINGVDQGLNDDSVPTSGNSVNSDAASHLVVGAQLNAGSPQNLFLGKISELAIWSSLLTEDEALKIHKGYQTQNINLDSDDGTYVSSADLIGWWRMGDSQGDSYPLIQNCAGLGSVISASGTLIFALSNSLTGFSTYSNGENISSGTFETSGSGAGGVQKQTLTVDKIYQLIYTHNAGDELDIRQADNNGANAITIVDNHTASGTVTAVYFVAKKEYLNFHLDGADESANIFVTQLYEYPPDSAAVMMNMATADIVSEDGIVPITGV